MRLLDFHTHLPNIERYRGDSSVVAVRSLMPDEEVDDRSDLFTVGIHPMDKQRYADPEGLLLRRIDPTRGKRVAPPAARAAVTPRGCLGGARI